ncbi:hypothetical protein OG365_39865 (plasmid) [Streptomyces sp. NBC_00853]|uniref:hypothetical protein n=1 Tax=Streptomyces sp. NBC_00853 TaxID=2903681 RepID=UPI003872AC27|nr:hypothetical protein OG365_39865 [Streptomyces sp. NBC_00853]
MFWLEVAVHVCGGIHPEDRTACEGPQDAVRVSDPSGGVMLVCVHHGARVLATVTVATVSPGSVPRAAIEAYRRAKETPPNVWQWDDEPMTLIEYAVWKGIDWEPTQAECVRHAIAVCLRFQVPGMSRDRAFLLGTTQVEATDTDLTLIADALDMTVERLRSGDLPGQATG